MNVKGKLQDVFLELKTNLIVAKEIAIRKPRKKEGLKNYS